MKSSYRLIILFLAVASGCQSPDNLELDRIAIMLKTGESNRLRAFDPETGNKVKVHWESSDPTIARQASASAMAGGTKKKTQRVPGSSNVPPASRAVPVSCPSLRRRPVSD